MLRGHFDKIIGELRECPDQSTLFITIFLGANDACFTAPMVHVPLDEFESHIRHYVDTILTEPLLESTKIILITPPPINSPSPTTTLIATDNASVKGRVQFRTYMSKKMYAERVMKIADSYGEVTDRVAGIDFWKSLVFDCLQLEGRIEENASRDVELDEDTLPGSGLLTANEFPRGTFTDGLHLGRLVSKELRINYDNHHCSDNGNAGIQHS